MDNPCPPQALAARTVALWDEMKGTDTSDQVLSHPGTSEDQALHYAAMGSAIADERNQNLYARIGIERDLKSPNNMPLPQALFRGFTDFDVYPHEVLGEEIVGPLREAHKALGDAVGQFAKDNPEIYKNRNKSPDPWNEGISEAVEQTGYFEAKQQAKQDIQDFYGDDQDPERFKYGNAWLNRHFPDDVLHNTMRYFSGNLIQSSTKNNLMLTYRHIFDNFRGAEAFGVDSWKAGWDAYKNPQAKEELKSLQVNADTYGPAKFDVLHKVASANQGITYFAAKHFAMKNGMDPTQAGQYAQLAVQHTQFRTSPIDQPKAFWNSNGLLGLMKYQVLERRWIQGIAKNAVEGWKTKDNPQGRQLLNQSLNTLAKFGLIKAVVFGASSLLPAETDYEEMMDPKTEKFFANIDKYSLSGMIGLDLGKYSRIPATPAGYFGRMGLFFNSLEQALDKARMAVNHPTSVHTMVNALGAAIRFAPDITPLGNGNIANGAEAMYRQFSGNYTRHTAKGQEYETSPQEEWTNVVRGGHQSIDRRINKLELETAQ